MLINYFQKRSMRVKWKGVYSKVRPLNGGGPQGGTLGILEFLSQSNDNANMVEPDDRFKFVDDLTILEIINLLIIQISSYDIINHVPSDIPTHNGYISKDKLTSQKNLSLINTWTKKKKMILNQKQTKNMVFNFTNKHNFTTRLNENGENIEVVTELKLLGTVLTDDLKWDRNTSYLVKKAYMRMQLLYSAAKFTKNKHDLKHIYITFIRPVLEQSAPVWHSSLTGENSRDIERVQKAAVRTIMGRNQTNYETSLKELKLVELYKRRKQLCLTFAKKTVSNQRMNHMFPVRKEERFQKRRYTEFYTVKKTNTERLKRSAIPYMQKLLNTYKHENTHKKASAK